MWSAKVSRHHPAGGASADRSVVGVAEENGPREPVRHWDPSMAEHQGKVHQGDDAAKREAGILVLALDSLLLGLRVPPDVGGRQQRAEADEQPHDPQRCPSGRSGGRDDQHVVDLVPRRRRPRRLHATARQSGDVQRRVEAGSGVDRAGDVVDKLSGLQRCECVGHPIGQPVIRLPRGDHAQSAIAKHAAHGAELVGAVGEAVEVDERPQCRPVGFEKEGAGDVEALRGIERAEGFELCACVGRIDGGRGRRRDDSRDPHPAPGNEDDVDDRERCRRDDSDFEDGALPSRAAGPLRCDCSSES